MKFAMILVILIMAAGMAGTIALGGRGTDNYSGSTKKNLTVLTMMYIVLALFLTAGLGLYIVL